MNKYRKLTIYLVFLGMISILVGVTYSFFNYTRTGLPNNFSVGRIYFASKNEETISLSNLFPIDPSNTTDMADPTKVGTYSIGIKGDSDYVDGIEYLISVVDAETYGLPISIDVTVTNLGTSEANYFTEREDKDTTIYKKLIGNTITQDSSLLVGFIKPNTTSGTIEGVNGSITMKAYLDKNKILVSDTYDGTESDNMGTTNAMAEGKTVLTTADWNALQQSGLSFKVKVEANEGIWVYEPKTLYGIMQEVSVMDNIQSTYVSASTGIDFGAVSSDTNGKGVYTRAGTENDPYPVYYYRGAVEDNNVVFGGFCWKAVRTTDTGGVKLIYNGELSSNKVPLVESEYSIVTNTAGFVYDQTDNTWTRTITGTDGSSSEPLEISFNVPSGEGYLMQISGTSSVYGSVSINIYKGSSRVDGAGNGGGYALSLAYPYGALTASDVIKVTYYGTGRNDSPSLIKFKMKKNDVTLGMGCDNSGSASQIMLNNIDTFTFNTSDDSPAYVGYMYGTVYAVSDSNWTSGARFGSSFTWDGTNYTLVDDTVTTPNATHHYSCNVTRSSGTCTQLRYVYSVHGSAKDYITLTGGDGIDEALIKMQANTNNSNAKDKIDTWYASNLTTYTNKLEDTIWCNDRSVVDNNNGWIANGGDLSTSMFYGASERESQPSLICVNKNDAFTWKNSAGNGALDYPVGMLTEDEIVLAGSESRSTNGDFYLKSGSNYWSLSPHSSVNAFEFYMPKGINGSGNVGNVDYTYGLRPAISLKPGTLVASGTGTALDPYVIE